MSTNYYLITEDTPEGGEGLHIGQHVAGLEFLFRAHPDRGLVSVATWTPVLRAPGVTIRSESGTPVSFEEFIRDATKRPVDVEPGERSIKTRGVGVTFRDFDARGVAFADYEFH